MDMVGETKKTKTSTTEAQQYMLHGCGLTYFHALCSNTRPKVLHVPTCLHRDFHAHLAHFQDSILDIQAGLHLSVIRTYFGKVYQWGSCYDTVFKQPSPVKFLMPNDPILSIACGRKHCLALSHLRIVYAWGHNERGQLGIGDENARIQPTRIEAFMAEHLSQDDAIANIAAGGAHSGVVSVKGAVYLWGFNRYHQCASYTSDNLLVPTLLTFPPKPDESHDDVDDHAARLALGRHHTCILTEQGMLYTWGASSFGRLGHSERCTYVKQPTMLPHFREKPVHSVACGDFHMLALTRDNEVFSWGFSSEGQCGQGSVLHYRSPRLVELLQGVTIVQVEAGGGTSMAVASNGDLYVWGSNDCGSLGLGEPQRLQKLRSTQVNTFDSIHNELLPRYVESLARAHVCQVACGGGHSLILLWPHRAISAAQSSPALAHLDSGEGLSDPTIEYGPPATTPDVEQLVSGSDTDEGALIQDSTRSRESTLSSYDINRIFSLCRHNRLAELDEILDLGYGIETRDEHGNTLLTIAAQNHLLQIGKMLLRRGADANVKNNCGQTPLHYCCKFGFSSFAELLLQHHADDTLINNDGLTCYEGLTSKDLDNF